MGNPDQGERGSGIGLRLFGFIPEPVFTFISESCSGSSRNAVRDHPGMPFGIIAESRSSCPGFPNQGLAILSI